LTQDNLHGQHICSVPYYYFLIAFEHKDINDSPFIINALKHTYTLQKKEKRKEKKKKRDWVKA
jgi:hypothetical protein